MLGHIFGVTTDWALNKSIPIAWWSAFLCVLFSARVATGFLRHNPRLFTVMALFACAWMHVLGYYSVQARGQPLGELSDLITDLAAFLMVYIGSLLVLETSTEPKSHRRILLGVVPLQTIAFSLLVVIATPRAIEITFPSTVQLVAVDDVKHLISAGVDLMAFVSIGLGAWGISKSNWALGCLVAIMIVYGGLEAYYNLQCLWSDCHNVTQMKPGDALAFAGLKLVFTFIFGCIVGYYGMTPKWREAGWYYWLLHFFYIAPDPPDQQVSAAATTTADPT